MPTVQVHPPLGTRTAPPSSLPGLLQTPLGLAIMELQGTINFPQGAGDASTDSATVGRLVFPEYDSSMGVQEGKWMKTVWFYVGHQRMTGEVKKLPKPLGVLRRLPYDRSLSGDNSILDKAAGDTTVPTPMDQLEIAEVIRWKLVFSSRPEPVGLSGI